MIILKGNITFLLKTNNMKTYQLKSVAKYILILQYLAFLSLNIICYRNLIKMPLDDLILYCILYVVHELSKHTEKIVDLKGKAIKITKKFPNKI